ncbi:hypothetical protein BDN67DRAFT_60739 [Paxillus ammoniavirescens]|nr:hypothetical protein BDN67DRAFT_60739 [Paxillus ammoniavirescens]
MSFPIPAQQQVATAKDLTSFETGILSGRIELVQHHSLYRQPIEVTREEMCCTSCGTGWHLRSRAARASRQRHISEAQVFIIDYSYSKSLWEAAGTQCARLEKVELPSRRSLAGPEQSRKDPPFRIRCSAVEHIHLRTASALLGPAIGAFSR